MPAHPSVIVTFVEMANDSPCPCPWASIWTSVGGDENRGYVNTWAEALKVKELFEIENGLKFNVEQTRQGKLGKQAGGGLGVGDGELKGKEDEQEEEEELEEEAAANKVKNKVMQQRIRFSDINNSLVVPDGVPFIIGSYKRTFSCMFGRDRRFTAKERAEKANDEELQKDHPLPRKRMYRLKQPSRKKSCTAHIEMKEVMRFPDYKVSQDASVWKKKLVSGEIRKAIEAEEKINTTTRIYISLPDKHDHNGHDVGKSTGFLKPIHPRVSHKLSELVGQGVSRLGEMKRHLRIFVETELSQDGLKPPTTDTAFYPSDEVIRSRMYAAKRKLGLLDRGMADNKQNTSNPTAKLVIQQCLSARLQVRPPSYDVEAEYVEIGQGIILYVCFLKDADQDTVEKMAKFALNIRLSEAIEGSKRVSILDLPGDVLIVPQATLGGKAKGKMMQYHANIPKDTGRELYQKFVELCCDTLASNARTSESNCQVRNGTYGNRQVLSMETNGPYTHTMEF